MKISRISSGLFWEICEIMKLTFFETNERKLGMYRRIDSNRQAEVSRRRPVWKPKPSENDAYGI